MRGKRLSERTVGHARLQMLVVDPSNTTPSEVGNEVATVTPQLPLSDAR